MRITKEEMVAATGTPNETGARLDWTLQCYADLEMKSAAAKRQIRDLEAALHAARNYIGTRAAEGDELAERALEGVDRALSRPKRLNVG